MSERTITFSSVRETQDVLGTRAAYLADIESLFGVQAVSRDLWLRLTGSASSVQKAEAAIQGVLHARNSGLPLVGGGVPFLLRAFADGREAEVDELLRLRIDVAPSRAPVFPRTFGQARLLKAIRSHTLTFGIGPAGTGKTWLAMAAAVSALLKGEVSRIVLTRPAVEAGEALGFLPGDLQQKIMPYLRPLYDALAEMLTPAQVAESESRGVLEIAPLAYMRGRTLNHAFVILDEAQNATREQMLMFLTRLGFDSKVVVNGDLTQVDLPSRRLSGLREAAALLRGVDDVAVVTLSPADVARHPLVQRIGDAYAPAAGGADSPPAAEAEAAP
jgi:phosphate starvation-inducible PhoH-like protein